ncbi:MAG: DUF692 domain-containing protein [Sulfurospirillaceae bacterium]|nr:DUF692 domain-containing protein [Sulfurospirillaceae bacterium]
MIDIKGCGLGLRRDFLHEIAVDGFLPDFWEVTPENWIYMPYHHREKFEETVALRPTLAHGLSLSIGSPESVNKKFLKEIKQFLDRYGIKYYSEHLSFSSFGANQTYELLPLPMTKKMALHVSDKVKVVEDILQRNLILENATYYHTPQSDLSESEFINMVLDKSGAKLLLDVNNVFVNSENHGYDAISFLDELDISKAAYIHVAGHYKDDELALIIDSHGMPVADQVWELLKHTLSKTDTPVMIERDNNIPPYKTLEKEYKKLQKLLNGVRHDRV